MKIKGSIKGLKINSAFSVFTIGTVIALAIRIYQCFAGYIDFETGFYEKQDITTYILYGVLAITAVLLLLLPFLSWEIPQEKMPEKKSTVVTLFSGLTAIALAYSAAQQLEAFNLTKSSYDPILETQSMMSYLMKSGALPGLLQGIFAALSAIFFILILLKYSGIKNVNFTKLKFITLCPLFWATFRMVERFTRTISFMNVSGLLLELFMIAFMMMFFMYLAQMASNVNAVAISWKIFSYGLISAMLSAVVAVPRFVMLAADESYRNMFTNGTLECTPEVADIAFLLFAVAFLALCLASPRIKNMTLKETEKLYK